MAISKENSAALAETRLQRERQRAADARTVMDEVKAGKLAEAEKTLRLRALRLAKEEADKLITATVPGPLPRRTRPSRPSSKS